MGRRAKASCRCPRCRMLAESCICDAAPWLQLDTRVLLLMHRREYKKVTNSGVLARLCLPNSEIRIWGDHEAPLRSDDLHDRERRHLVLTPADGSVELDRALIADDPRPLTLVVPDGTWRQAIKMPRRIPALSSMTWVRLPVGAPTGYRLRQETKDGGLATFEAIARALGIIESHAAQRVLETFFQRMVGAVMASRGKPVTS